MFGVFPPAFILIFQRASIIFIIFKMSIWRNNAPCARQRDRQHLVYLINCWVKKLLFVLYNMSFFMRLAYDTEHGGTHVENIGIIV